MVKTATYVLNVGTAAISAYNGTALILKAPDSAKGGGITIIDGFAVNGAATSGANSFRLRLLDMGSTGTTLSGTAADWIGGTGSHWAANTPKRFTTNDYFLAAGRYLGLAMEVQGTGQITTPAVVQVLYVMGRGSN
jgi:hypothetical protein